MKLRNFLRSIVIISLIIFIWELISFFNSEQFNYVPKPSSILLSFYTNSSLIFSASIYTAIEFYLGSFFGILFGWIVGVFLNEFEFFQKAFLNIMAIFEAIPKIALAPIIIVWLGIGSFSKIVIVTLITVFPVTISVLRGLSATPKEIVMYSKLIGSSRLMDLILIKIPGSLPFFLDSLKIVIPLGMVGAIVGEFISSQNGLGNILLSAIGQMDFPLAFSIIMMIAIIVSITMQIVLFIEGNLIQNQDAVR